VTTLSDFRALAASVRAGERRLRALQSAHGIPDASVIYGRSDRVTAPTFVHVPEAHRMVCIEPLERPNMITVTLWTGEICRAP